MRIVSLVPSITELLYDLDLHQDVVGITKFCVRPEAWFRTKTRVGGTKTVDREKILALKPDWVIANKEENTKEDIEFLMHHTEVYVSNINTVDDALRMIRYVGEKTQRSVEAESMVKRILQSIKNYAPVTFRKAYYFIWQNPYMVAGRDTFIHNMMHLAGFENLCTANRYPEISEETILEHKPEVILLSSEPFPFKEKHRLSWQAAYPDSKILLVDGEIFSWYGSRMLHAIDYFRGLNEQSI